MHDIEITRTPAYIAECIITDYISDINDSGYMRRPSVKDLTARSMRIYSANQVLEKIREDPYDDPLDIVLREKEMLVSLSKSLLKNKNIGALDASGDTLDYIIDVLGDALHERKYT